MKQKEQKPYDQMTPKELAEATAEFDREFIAETFKPLDQEARALWEKARRKLPGRPRNGAGAAAISVSIERRLLERTDRLARQKRVTRASLIARGLRAVLARERVKP